MTAVAQPDSEEQPLGEPSSRFSALLPPGIRVRLANPRSPGLLHVRAMLAGVRGIVVLEEGVMRSSALTASYGTNVVIAEFATAELAPRAAIRELARGSDSAHILVMSARRDVEEIRDTLDAGG